MKGQENVTPPHLYLEVPIRYKVVVVQILPNLLQHLWVISHDE